MLNEEPPRLLDLVKIWAKESGLPIKIAPFCSEAHLLSIVAGQEIQTAVIHEREIELRFNKQNCYDFGKEWSETYSQSHIVYEHVHASDPQLFEKLEKLVRSDLTWKKRT